jgi:Trypsin-co-occurring domain 1
MSAQMIVEFQDGQQILFGGTDSGTGLSEVGVEEEIAKRTEAAFRSGIGAIGKLMTTLEESVGAMPKRPDKIEMEFGATLSADCKLWIVSGKGDYAIKVKLSWE